MIRPLSTISWAAMYLSFGFTAVRDREPARRFCPLWMHPAAIYLAHAPKSLPMN